MSLITAYELAHYSEATLAQLFRVATHTLAQSERGSPERRDALATLDNIACARARRMIAA
jgi:DNA-binding XRE family transcriptional regulator